MNLLLKDKVVLVTGGAGGIGSAICKKMAEHGANVLITYNSNAEKAEQLLKLLDKKGNHAIFHAPITDSHQLKALSDFVKTNYGKLDILVNNAGITTPVPHDDLDGLTDEWIDKILQTNVRGSFAMIRACKSLLINAFDGIHASLVVNISSVAAVTGIGSNVAYCASKAAIDSMTRSLGRALAPQIRVVSVSPGWVLGEYAKKIDPVYLKLQQDLTPLGRLATPEDVANTILALATYLTFTTGNIVPVDGGRPLK
jgi:3-oxoacyl-[acyl-carrier protein] reductase